MPPSRPPAASLHPRGRNEPPVWCHKGRIRRTGVSDQFPISSRLATGLATSLFLVSRCVENRVTPVVGRHDLRHVSLVPGRAPPGACGRTIDTIRSILPWPSPLHTHRRHASTVEPGSRALPREKSSTAMSRWPDGTTREGSRHDASVTRTAAKMNAVQLHGFADESRRGPLYLVTVVTVPTDVLDAARRAVRAVVQRGSKRTHLSAEGAARRRQILGEYARLGLGVEAHVAVAAYDRGDDQVPRDRCLAALLETCRDVGMTRLTLDTRHPDRDRLDRRTNRGRAARQAGAVRSRLRPPRLARRGVAQPARCDRLGLGRWWVVAPAGRADDRLRVALQRALDAQNPVAPLIGGEHRVHFLGYCLGWSSIG